MRLDLDTRFDTKSKMALRLQKSERSRKKVLLRIEIEPNDHYQNVALGLEFVFQASKPQNIPSRTNKYRKLRQNKKIQGNYNYPSLLQTSEYP